MGSPQFEALSNAIFTRIVHLFGLDRGRVWHHRGKLDPAVMQRAADRLVGRHDFTSFRASQCQANSPVRTLDELHVETAGEEIHVHAAALSFLHHQVRNIVGTLALVGGGKWTADDVSDALAAKDRAAAGCSLTPSCPLSGVWQSQETSRHAPDCLHRLTGGCCGLFYS